MKAIRWILGFVWVFVFVFLVDLVFYNYVFNSMLMVNVGLVRYPEELRRLLPLTFLGQFLFALFFTYYFFKIYKTARFIVARGIIFGFWIGLFLFGWRTIWEWYLFNMDKKLPLSMLALGWTECVIAGFGLGLIGWLIPFLFSKVETKAQGAPPPESVPEKTLTTEGEPVGDAQSAPPPEAEPEEEPGTGEAPPQP